ncbi:tumor necrosis factor receptor superfamily member 5 isoform X2 [Thalassophryne amazonica]|uniref:tumor necrosis factor receptor superfamily member 5 isoform X2 n=1 Tax=Thalassophryne amazonica TaxID=390379 RepID=UPI001471BBF0|nr:tumor necrosis factor receptor superfamily member 5 isoform X2 [Thalassophryne amazonica]
MRLWMLLMGSTVGFVVVSAAGFCDPATEYESNGQCCQKCDPGTYMTSHGSCLEPQCIACGDNEYQESYTTESKCKRQPYCDPNKNFDFIEHHKSKTQRSTCMCKLGFHCSSETCLTCVPHRTCGPGYGVQSKGDHAHDTVCEVCSPGTFSNETSWDGSCQKWTECEDGYPVEKSGTAVSDNICEKTSRWYPVWICLGVLLVAAVICAAVLILCKRKVTRDAEGEMEGCMKSCLEGRKKPEQTAKKITNPTSEDKSKVNLVNEHLPEEVDDNVDEESVGSPTFTEKGNFLRQEVGKDAILSRQESQTQSSEIF